MSEPTYTLTESQRLDMIKSLENARLTTKFALDINEVRMLLRAGLISTDTFIARYDALVVKLLQDRGAV